jgi:hydroxyacylglutathione hydrolase
MSQEARDMAELQIHQFNCLSDNFGVLIHDASQAVTASIDTPEAAAIEKALAEKGWRLTHILNTHHHGDHTGGNLALKGKYGCTIVGPRGEADKIPGIDVKVGGGDLYKLGSFDVEVIDTPGHTAGQINYFLPQAKVAFTGDTLFSLGCGRLFEKGAQEMWGGLEKLMRLPGDTMIYCGHEYTASNAKFALTIEPENQALQKRAEEVAALRAAGKPTLPTRLDRELATNPFLRPSSPAIQARLGMKGEPLWKIFGEIRARKDKG